MTRTVTGQLMGDPPPERAAGPPPPAPTPIPRFQRPTVADAIAADLDKPSAGASSGHGAQASVEAAPPSAPAETQLSRNPGELSARHIDQWVSEPLKGDDTRLATELDDAAVTQKGINSLETLRPVAAICIAGIEPGAPPTESPIFEWMAPSDLLVDGAYQRDLSDKSVKLIRRIVEHWDWRRFKPPVVAMTAAGFEIIDGQHTAIAAATHPSIEKIPVLVVEATEQQDRASAFIGHNKDRLAVTAVQMHQAAATSGDPDAVTLNQVCERAGVTLVTSPWGGRAYQAGETIAVGAIARLIDQRTPLKARMILQSLVSAGCAPITANEIRAADLLFSNPDYSNDLEPLPEGGADLAQAIRNLGASAGKEIKDLATIRCMPIWKATAAVWFKKTRKRRRTT